MRVSSICIFASLVLALPAVGQPAPRPREAMVRQEIGKYAVTTFFNVGSTPQCNVIGPLGAPFGMNIGIDREKHAMFYLINPSWNLNRGSKGTVTLKTGGRTLTRVFGVQGGSSATTMLYAFVPESDPDHGNAADLALAAATSGSPTEVGFADGQTYRYDAPPEAVRAAFQACLADINRPS